MHGQSYGHVRACTKCMVRLYKSVSRERERERERMSVCVSTISTCTKKYVN